MVHPPPQINAEELPGTDTEHPQTARGFSEQSPATGNMEHLETVYK